MIVNKLLSKPQTLKQMKHVLLIMGLLAIFTIPTLANKTSVTIEGPQKAKEGQEVTITIHVKHSGNSALHYTDWVKVRVNGEVIKEWNYSRKQRPENENFKLSFTYKIDSEVTFEVEGHCNAHGSEGVAKHTIKISET